ncbi:uncharacterized protein LOC109862472 [Pseudomyrmex gracilis]|uniref:uncharacterized protein LOC109862472 n=1 Tax=Pseudomyrmex gracilis TaxID=219809 RepID=UPI000994FD21|nr:uncharacterized protein LOC109862472 [Pseudomyrmex gracilis]
MIQWRRGAVIALMQILNDYAARVVFGEREYLQRGCYAIIYSGEGMPLACGRGAEVVSAFVLLSQLFRKRDSRVNTLRDGIGISSQHLERRERYLESTSRDRERCLESTLRETETVSRVNTSRSGTVSPSQHLERRKRNLKSTPRDRERCLRCPRRASNGFGVSSQHLEIGLRKVLLTAHKNSLYPQANRREGQGESSVRSTQSPLLVRLKMIETFLDNLLLD